MHIYDLIRTHFAYTFSPRRQKNELMLLLAHSANRGSERGVLQPGRNRRENPFKTTLFLNPNEVITAGTSFLTQPPKGFVSSPGTD